MTDKEKIAYAKGMAQAYFNVSNKIWDEITTTNLYMISRYCLNESKRIDDGIKRYDNFMAEKKYTVADYTIELLVKEQI